MPHVARTLSKPGYEVELAVSPLAGLKGVAGYHSSVLISGEEYFFSPMGIIHSPNISSHKRNPHMQRIFIGLSRYSGSDLVEFFDIHFPPGHYDLLRKNCNSFSDCALYFLCEQRLDHKFKTVERFGKLADDNFGIIKSISAGEYVPNPQALGFDLDAVIAEIDVERPNIEVDLDNARAEYNARADYSHDKDYYTHFPESTTTAENEVLQSDPNVFAVTTPPDLIDFSHISSARSIDEDQLDLVCEAYVDQQSDILNVTISNISNIGGPVSPLKPSQSHGKSTPGGEDGSVCSGPTDPLGITYNAPAATWHKPRGPVKGAIRESARPAKGAVRETPPKRIEELKRKEPRAPLSGKVPTSWQELRQVPAGPLPPPSSSFSSFQEESFQHCNSFQGSLLNP